MRDMDYGVKLITRAEWGARAPTSVTPLNPTYGATRHWGGPGFGAPFPHESCASKVRGWQNFHMGPDRGWTDIAYTGVVCPHGYVFEGRSLWVRTAANGTNTGNNTAYAFCYLGGEGDEFTEAGKRAMKAAMNWTRDWGGAGPNRNDHNDWKQTTCPGSEIEAWGDSGEPITFEEDDDLAYTEQQLHEIIKQAVRVLLFDEADTYRPEFKRLVRTEAVNALREITVINKISGNEESLLELITWAHHAGFWAAKATGAPGFEGFGEVPGGAVLERLDPVESSPFLEG